MKPFSVRTLLISCFLIIFSLYSCKTPLDVESADSQLGKPIVTLINSSGDILDPTLTLTEGGRHLVTLSYGINMVTLEGDLNNTSLHWNGSEDFGKTWAKKSSNLGARTSGIERFPAIDANINGSFISYVEQSGNISRGYVIHLPNPYESPNEFRVFGPLTPENNVCKHSFISASKSAKNIIYGWTDTERGEIYVGHSEDGEKFQPALLINRDEYALSGPAVSIEDNYAALVYQSSNPKFYPKEYKGLKNKAFPVWMESVDGGKTWSSPSMLLGKSIEDFPSVDVTIVSESSKITRTKYRVGNGSNIADRQTSALVWASPTIDNPLVFFMNSQTIIDDNGNFEHLNKSPNCVGIVSFKPSKLGDNWTHVISNKSVLRDFANSRDKISYDHKYGALPKTTIRVVSYIEKEITKNGSSDNLIVMISDNGGKSFDTPVAFNTQSLGLKENQTLIYDSSPCLRSDKNGDVWMDISYLKTEDGIARDGSLYHAALPLPRNVSKELLMRPSNGPSPW